MPDFVIQRDPSPNDIQARYDGPPVVDLLPRVYAELVRTRFIVETLTSSDFLTRDAATGEWRTVPFPSEDECIPSGLSEDTLAAGRARVAASFYSTVFCICKPPFPGSVHRRMDLKQFLPEELPAGLCSWTGNTLFNRTMKEYVGMVGFELDDKRIMLTKVRHALQHAGVPGAAKGASGRITLAEAVADRVHLTTEFDVFNYLGLAFVPPHLRNVLGEE